MTQHHLVNGLIILDGWGLRAPSQGNAVHMARTPFLDTLKKDFPTTSLACSGNAVGLPQGVMGNSEVGHMNIGAGRTVFQDLVRINAAIASGEFFTNPALTRAMTHAATHNTTLHLLGLLSDGGVHSHIDHLTALIDMAGRLGVKDIAVHGILDGRDTPPQSGISYVRQLQDYLDQAPGGRMASLCGRFYAMDRDTRWERVEKAYDLYTLGKGREQPDAVTAVEAAYAAGETDEFVKPVHISPSAGDSPGILRADDALVFFNFRADRAREITRAFTEKEFTAFNRKAAPCLGHFVCMTRYDETFPLAVAFGPQHLDRILGEEISRHGLRQLRIAETEKYAHVTYFFNGGDEQVFPGESRILVPSPREVNTYDEKPEMSAPAVAEKACQAIAAHDVDFMVLNFANMDMVGHTGIPSAAVTACETVDRCVAQVVTAIWETGGTAMVTADHGNAEEMTQADGSPHTAHTLNPVPFILAGDRYRNMALKTGVLGDIAPTVLKVLELPVPREMTGTPLF